MLRFLSSQTKLAFPLTKLKFLEKIGGKPVDGKRFNRLQVSNLRLLFFVDGFELLALSFIGFRKEG